MMATGSMSNTRIDASCMARVLNAPNGDAILYGLLVRENAFGTVEGVRLDYEFPLD